MNIDELRREIDKLDSEIVRLLNHRYKLVEKVGEWKKNCDHEIYVPEREKALLNKLEKINKGPMKNETLQAVYREIMSGALALEEALKIAYLGPSASFSELAAYSKFGRSVEYIPKTGISGVFHEVETGRADYGCIPIENSTEGAVNHTLDKFIGSNTKICAEINLRIHHILMGKCELCEIEKIYSHAQVFGQCRAWIQEHLSNAELIELASTARAAEKAAVEKNSAAIASTLAAELYGLNIIMENIEDNSENTTRFMIIGNQEPKATGDDKTSICFSVKDRVGILYESLLPFKNNGITLTMIESRPSRKRNWEYFFFVDVLGHRDDEKLSKAISELSEHCQFIRILGSYPRADKNVNV